MTYTLEQYNNLESDEQHNLVFTKGYFVDYYIKEEKRYSMYSLFKFFVEVEYSVTQNKIVNLVAFQEGKLLERYYIVTDLKY
ncbi:hypothetical protein [uncultured Marixanthomonas sp.]|uniref:hypothetical protein n=1 Tax=uncultured Marixanthomonas sp. TaxID=757245 RepID=UPI0030D82672|tara:strand:+ start:58363 stop:58608 length:246 start_codon:yes stop_codon:yes gene_type:complete